MAERAGRRWTRAEATAALALYCQLPFGRMHKTNPRVQALARILGRTPSSVAMKLVNFASFDPDHQRRGVRGMGNASALDREVWDGYYGNWEALAAAETAAEESVRDARNASDFQTDAYRTTLARRGQSFFRQAVLAAYNDCCCITGIRSRSLLRASHIVPWASRVETRLDPRNGLLLNALHDAAFDRGAITLDESLRLVLSPSLSDQMPKDTHREFFQRFKGQRISTPERFAPHLEYLKFHRATVFIN